MERSAIQRFRKSDRMFGKKKMNSPLLPPVGNGGLAVFGRLGFFHGWRDLMDMREESNREADEIVSIVGLVLKILAHLIIFVAFGAIGFFAARWMFFS